jgi:hypothetical protein
LKDSHNWFRAIVPKGRLVGADAPFFLRSASLHIRDPPQISVLVRRSAEVRQENSLKILDLLTHRKHEGSENGSG